MTLGIMMLSIMLVRFEDGTMTLTLMILGIMTLSIILVRF